MNETESMGIEGLFFKPRWRTNIGTDSYVVPFASIRPINYVFHGEVFFDYGHYAIHLGQEDRLTFLGDPKTEFTAQFIDCREGSSTHRKRVKCKIRPSSGKTLCIAPGIAHTFQGLENINTINDYNLYLPDPQDWIDETVPWSIENLTVYVPLDVVDAEIPAFKQNENIASDLMYRLIAELTRATLKVASHLRPETEHVKSEFGTSASLPSSAPLRRSADPELFKEKIQIDDFGWKKHPVVSSGPNSGFVPMLDAQPMYVVDHGSSEHAHDAYEIHISQEDHLTFLGSSSNLITLDLVDCREHSPTLHNRQTVKFHPDPNFYLVIPNGVAHRFHNLENIFTVNKPTVKVDDWMAYDSANDVIDWPVDKQDFPILNVPSNYAPQEFYNKQAVAQRSHMSGSSRATPVEVMEDDPVTGKQVRVAVSES